MEVDDDNNVSKKQKQNVNLDEVETYVRKGRQSEFSPSM